MMVTMKKIVERFSHDEQTSRVIHEQREISEHATLTIFGFLEAPPDKCLDRMGKISASRFSEGDALFSASSLFLL